MRRKAVALATGALFTFTGTALADALPFRDAKKLALRLVQKDVNKNNPDEWSLSHAHRLSANKITFRYDAKYSNGRECVAKIVVRGNSRRSSGEFRDARCFTQRPPPPPMTG